MATDDIGIVGMTVHWRVRTSADQTFHRALLFDDGLNQDGGRLDGVFAGVVEAALPEGTELEFYLEAEDLSGEKKFVPGRPAAASEEEVADELYTLRFPGLAGPTRAVELSEIVSSNQRTVPDDTGQFADYLLRGSVLACASQLNSFKVCNHVHKVAECRAWTGKIFSVTITARISWS